MEQLSVEEGNKLIAEFMGAKKNHIGIGSVYTFISPPTKHSSYQWDYYAMEYHSSWDWLMPVVAKINNLGGYDVVIWKADCHINDEVQIIFESSILKEKQTLISIVWQTVVKFIQWYQTQNTQP